MSETHEDIMPVGYVTKNELTKLRLGASCVDLFGQVVPKGFEMVPLYSAPVYLTSELTRLREENERLRKIETEAAAYVASVTGEPEKDCWDTEDGKEAPGAERFASDWSWQDYDNTKQAAFDDLRAALSPDNSTQKKEGEV